MDAPVPVDPEIASATMLEHFDRLWATGRPERLGWMKWHWDPMHVVVRLPARRASGEVDHYLARLGATYYDAFPPTVAFVGDDGKTPARQGTRAFPTISGVPWFGLHDAYEYPPDKQKRQLVCFSVSVEYYMTGHRPDPPMVWRQGRHTVAATLSRLAEVLQPPYYQGPSGP